MKPRFLRGFERRFVVRETLDLEHRERVCRRGFVAGAGNRLSRGASACLRQLYGNAWSERGSPPAMPPTTITYVVFLRREPLHCARKRRLAVMTNPPGLAGRATIHVLTLLHFVCSGMTVCEGASAFFCGRSSLLSVRQTGERGQVMDELLARERHDRAARWAEPALMSVYLLGLARTDYLQTARVIRLLTVRDAVCRSTRMEHCHIEDPSGQCYQAVTVPHLLPARSASTSSMPDAFIFHTASSTMGPPPHILTYLLVYMDELFAVLVCRIDDVQGPFTSPGLVSFTYTYGGTRTSESLTSKTFRPRHKRRAHYFERLDNRDQVDVELFRRTFIASRPALCHGVSHRIP